MEIKSGVGVGKIKYGILETELISILGEPDRVEEEYYSKKSKYLYRMLNYSSLDLEFFFDEEDNYRLGSINVSGYGYTLFDKDLHGKTIEQVKSFLSVKTNEIPKYENFTVDDSNSHECIDYDTLGMLFWFKSGVLAGIDCNYLFEDDGETEVWPT